MRKFKYKNTPVEIDGIRFDSKAEGKRYSELLLLEKSGVIQNLQLQPRYDLIVNDKNCGFYKADFRYEENGNMVIEDVKGFKTSTYNLKKRLVEAIYPDVKITEIKP